MATHARTILALTLACWLCSAERAAGTDYEQNNVIIVLDASGSMGDRMRATSMRKIDAAKKALCAVLKTVPADTQVGLLVFSASNLVDDWVYPLGPRDDEKLLEAIDRPEPGGRTPLGIYTKMAADALLAQRKKQFGYGSYRLLVVTDGEADDPELVDRYVPDVMARGLTIDVIGVDMRSDHTMATKVHSYRRADDPAALTRAVAEVFAEVADTGSDTASEEAFDELAAIPDELAVEMVKALSTSGNHPIGQRPAVQVADAADDESQSTAAAGASNAQPPQADSQVEEQEGFWTWKSVILFAVIGLILLGQLRKLLRRRN